MVSNGIMYDLGTLGGNVAYAGQINDNGLIVGESFPPGNVTYHAFLYSGGTMLDLNQLLDSSDAN